MVMFDVNLSLGRWPFRPSELENRCMLASYLSKHGVTGGLVRSAEAVFSRAPDLDNQRLFSQCQDWPGFLPLPVVHPEWSFWKEFSKVPAAALYPTFHSYSLTAGATIDMARALARRGLLSVVVLREEDERAQHPLCRVPKLAVAELDAFAQALGNTPVLALNAYLGEILASQATNLHFDLAFAEGFPTLPALLDKLGSKRLLLGSHAPYFCVSAALVKLERSSSEDMENIVSRNATRLLRPTIGE